jgi:deoxycytidylate deaminase
MNKDERFINLASKVAVLSAHKFRIGAVIVQGSRTISFGINKYKSHPKQMNHHTAEHADSIHAELDAIINSRGNAEGATIYIVRLLQDGTIAMARPCFHCIKELKSAGVKRIVYSTQGGYAKERI